MKSEIFSADRAPKISKDNILSGYDGGPLPDLPRGIRLWLPYIKPLDGTISPINRESKGWSAHPRFHPSSGVPPFRPGTV